MEQDIITIEILKQQVPFFRTHIGGLILRMLFSITGMKKVNSAYREACKKEGIDFITLLLEKLHIKYVVDNPEELDKFPKEFITVSNHPYGGVDGIILLHLIASRHPDYKIIVNWILNYVKAMSNFFICVDPVSSKVNKRNISGVKLAQKHLANHFPMGVFPAGSVSKLKIDHGLHVQDMEWHDTIIKLVKSAKRPIIPIYFHGHNSLLFYLLGIIHWKIRMLRLPREVFNKQKKTIHITIGRPILVEEQNKYNDIHQFCFFLKEQTYRNKHVKTGTRK